MHGNFLSILPVIYCPLAQISSSILHEQTIVLLRLCFERNEFSLCFREDTTANIVYEYSTSERSVMPHLSSGLMRRWRREFRKRTDVTIRSYSEKLHTPSVKFP